MTHRRWIADEVSGNHAFLIGSHADHLIRVLRARVGQEFDIVVDGVLRRGRIVTLNDEKVGFELGQEISSPPPSQIILAISIFKFDRMEWAIEKCTELAVARIVPVVAQRTETHLAAAAPKRLERWQRIARQASEQSRRLAPPEISPPVKLKEIFSFGTGIVLDETERTVKLKDLLQPDSSDETMLAFGPEGGWTESEMKQFHGAGWKSASLGGTILRAETAVIAATAIANSILAQ